jgi:hypothetical protein
VFGKTDMPVNQHKRAAVRIVEIGANCHRSTQWAPVIRNGPSILARKHLEAGTDMIMIESEGITESVRS